MNPTTLVERFESARTEMLSVRYRLLVAQIEQLDAPLRSAATDGGPRSSGASNPTETEGMRRIGRRSSTEALALERATNRLAEAVSEIAELARIVAQPTPRRGECSVCLRSRGGELLDEGFCCARCRDALRKWLKRSGNSDPNTWRRERREKASRERREAEEYARLRQVRKASA